MSIVFVRNIQAALLLEGFLKRAIEATPSCAPLGFESVTGELLSYIVDPTRYMMIGLENGTPVAVVLWLLSDSPMFPYPTVSLIYSEGSPAIKRELGKVLFNTISELGFDKIWVVNATGHSEEVWARGVLPEGLGHKRLGEVIEVSIPRETQASV